MKTRKKTFTINADKDAIHVGNIIKEYITRNEIYKSPIARDLKRSDQAILRFQNGYTMQTTILVEFCHSLKRNFFMDIALLLPKSYSSNLKPDTSKDEEIVSLKKEIELLKAQNEVLREVVRK